MAYRDSVQVWSMCISLKRWRTSEAREVPSEEPGGWLARLTRLEETQQRRSSEANLLNPEADLQLLSYQRTSEKLPEDQ